MCLVLSRRVGESVVITTESGERIVIKQVACGRGRSKLGVFANRATTVLRGELVEADEEKLLESVAA